MVFKKSAVILAAAIIITYWPALRAGFIYDDKFFVVENESIRNLSDLPLHFTDPKATTASIPWNPIWRPLRNVTYAVDYQIWGLNPLGYHLTNLLLHWLNALLVASILKVFFPQGWGFLLGGLLFALHPVQAESVIWISGRDDLLVATFVLLCWRLFAGYRPSGHRHYLWLSWALYVPALLSKETAMAMPLSMAAADLWQVTPDKRIKKRWLIYLPWIALSVVYFIIRLQLLGRLGHRSYWGGTFLSNLLTMLWVLFQYLRLLICPLWLRVDYIIPPVVSLIDLRWLAGLILVLGISLVVWHYRKLRWPGIAWLWFLIMLLPVSNLIPIAAIMAERFLYLPLVGLSLLVGWLTNRVRPKTMVVTAGIILLLFMGLNLRRGWEWRAPEVFWRTEIKRSPGSAIAHNNLGHYYYRRQQLDSAEVYFSQAIKLNPSLAAAQASLGDVYYHQGQYQKALNRYLEYLRLQPDAYNRAQAERRIEKIRESLNQR